MQTQQTCDLTAEHMLKVHSAWYSSNSSENAIPKGRPSQIIQLTDRTSVCDERSFCFGAQFNSLAKYLFCWGCGQVSQCIKQLLIHPSTLRETAYCSAMSTLYGLLMWHTFFILHMAWRTCRFMYVRSPCCSLCRKFWGNNFCTRQLIKVPLLYTPVLREPRSLKTPPETKLSLCNQ